MQEIIDFFSATYFTKLFMPIIQLAIGLYCIAKNSTLRELRIFTIYFLAGFIESSSSLLLFLSKASATTYSIFTDTIIYVFTTIELIAFQFYFLKISTSILSKNYNKWSIILFGGVTLFFVYNHNFYDFDFRYIFLIEALLILSSCFIYLFEIFKNIDNTDLTKKPSFWITTGGIFFFLTTIPVNLFFDNNHIVFLSGKNLINIIFISYIILFLMIFKAIRCKIEETK